jgi:Glycosyltransferase Family 4
MNIRLSRLNNIPRIERVYRYCLPLFPRLIESFDLRNYDLIVSSSHCVAKGVFPHRALHISYVHTPMRYVWDMHDAYFGRGGSLLARVGMFFWRRCLQRWDVAASKRVDHFLANSLNVAAKIRKLYGRQATVIHPPVDLKHSALAAGKNSTILSSPLWSLTRESTSPFVRLTKCDFP